MKGMPISTVLIVILVVAVTLWLVNSYIPMQLAIKGILNGMTVIVLIIWILKVFGAFDSLQNVTI